MGKMFEGKRTKVGAQVAVDGQPLSARRDIENFSQTGLEWADRGRGAAQLALAMLAHVCADSVAQELYRDFLEEVVARLEPAGWTVLESEVRRWVLQPNVETWHQENLTEEMEAVLSALEKSPEGKLYRFEVGDMLEGKGFRRDYIGTACGALERAGLIGVGRYHCWFKGPREVSTVGAEQQR